MDILFQVIHISVYKHQCCGCAPFLGRPGFGSGIFEKSGSRTGSLKSGSGSFLYNKGASLDNSKV